LVARGGGDTGSLFSSAPTTNQVNFSGSGSDDHPLARDIFFLWGKDFHIFTNSPRPFAAIILRFQFIVLKYFPVAVVLYARPIFLHFLLL